ncbi:PDDEXK nuclease domain-containing protein [Arcicella sp. DC2W]|uniref:PDDEXK nuclease domain-containing protein n=1 Tax=Arcicella gelida TaxID=2984195 RepID=A0ABU5S139_9BACT|nr:PDDEXK nuclease domain-containing protein [Arcicella sp. DC2W]MEA5402152.1 PDDEXK nuclease domain-containing protein [Arcicella sp. DC2W]
MSISTHSEYKDWLRELKANIKKSQIKASLAVNSELIQLYWHLGKQIVEKQENAKWGSGFIDQLSKDLKEEFPSLGGFSAKNLRYCKAFYEYYSNPSIWQQLVSKLETLLFNIPWGHHILIIQRIKNQEEAIFYVQQTIENNWSRAVLDYQIETKLYQRQGKAITNFKNTLPEPESDLANALLKDSYNFEFLTLSSKVKELELEQKLIENITHFLLELGKGFAYLGRQFEINVGGELFKTDLLFYHTKLKCYVVIELKVTKFKPEYVGKLNFYVTAIDRVVKDSTDKPTIGILLCRSKNDVVVDFALHDVNKPMGVSEYTYTELPTQIQNALPTIEQFTERLNQEDEADI